MLAERVVARATEGRVANTKMAKPQVFDRTSSKVSKFITACRLYIRIRMREIVVEEQIQ